MSEELKPCPFCGGAETRQHPNIRNVQCRFCGSSGPGKKRKISGEAGWNTRAPDERDAEIERLREIAATFIALHGVRYAETLGLPSGHLHPEHYDLLAETGGRMDAFTRANMDTAPLCEDAQ